LLFSKALSRGKKIDRYFDEAFTKESGKIVRTR